MSDCQIKEMGSLFGNLFRKKESKTPHVDIDTSARTAECVEILALKDEIDKLCAKQHYVARSEYRDILPKYQKHSYRT